MLGMLRDEPDFDYDASAPHNKIIQELEDASTMEYYKVIEKLHNHLNENNITEIRFNNSDWKMIKACASRDGMLRCVIAAIKDTQVCMLDLSNNGLNDREIKAIADTLTIDKTLIDIVLSNNSFTHKAFEQFTKVVRANRIFQKGIFTKKLIELCNIQNVPHIFPADLAKIIGLYLANIPEFIDAVSEFKLPSPPEAPKVSEAPSKALTWKSGLNQVTKSFQSIRMQSKNKAKEIKRK